MNDLNLEGAIAADANRSGVDLRKVNVFVGGEGLGDFIDLVGDLFGGGCAIGEVVLDAKVVVGTWK